MIIDLRTIPHGTRRYDYCLEKGWWHSGEENDQISALDIPLEVKIEINKAGDKYILDGDLSGGLQVRCDRCLELYHRDLRSVFKVFLALPMPEMERIEVELSDEDMEVGFIRGEEIELNDIVREQVYLSLPMKLLCSKNCLGLCPVCGGNLNKRDCQCNTEQGHPGFLKLKNLKFKETGAK